MKAHAEALGVVHCRILVRIRRNDQSSIKEKLRILIFASTKSPIGLIGKPQVLADASPWRFSLGSLGEGIQSLYFRERVSRGRSRKGERERGGKNLKQTPRWAPSHHTETPPEPK